MKDLLNEIFKNDEPRPSVEVLRGFTKSFPGAINAEWMKDRDEWEVIFYQDQVEKIVRLSAAGNVLETRTNISIGEIPLVIQDTAARRGEIMNVILIRRFDEVYWEIIYRDKELVRFLLILNKDGGEIKQYPL